MKVKKGQKLRKTYKKLGNVWHILKRASIWVWKSHPIQSRTDTDEEGINLNWFAYPCLLLEAKFGDKLLLNAF